MAKRVSSWTTRGVLSALVVVLGLGLGRDLVHWWRGDAILATPEENPFVLADALGDPSRTHDFQFGELPGRLSRKSFFGSREGATSALRAACRRMASSEPPAGELPGPAEKKLLERLCRQQPVEEERGKWRLYEVGGEFPMVAVTRETPKSAAWGSGAAKPALPSARKAESEAPNEDPRVAPNVARMVTWGLAVPSGKDAWTLFTFSATAPADDLGPGLEEIPLPPESRKLVSLRVADGGALVSFRGKAPVDRWQHFFDDWFQQRGWTGGDRWYSSRLASQRRFRSPVGPAQQRVEVYLRQDGAGQLTGLILLHQPNHDQR